MKVMLVIFALAGGCGGSVCLDAANKLRGCGITANQIGGECNQRSQCESKCILEASCQDIKTAFMGTPNTYSMCDDACGQ